MSKNVRSDLEDIKINIKLKLSALWVTLVLLYGYGDLIGFFRPGTLKEIMDGKAYVFDITQGFLLSISIYVIIPALMVFLSLVLKPKLNRWANIILGVIYGATTLLSAIGDDYAYYIFFMIVDSVIALLIIWHAWNWPKATLINP